MKYAKLDAFTIALGCAFLSQLIPLPSFVAAVESGSETTAISGFNPDKAPGVFDLADCQEPSGKIGEHRLRIPGIEDVFDLGIDFILAFLQINQSEARQELEKHREKIIKDAVKAHEKGKEIHLAAFSWGSTLALRVAWDLKEKGIPIKTVILLDRVTLGYPLDIRPPESPQGLPRVPDNVEALVAIRQNWDGLPFLMGGDVAIDDDQKTRILANLNIREDSGDAEVEELLQRVLQEYANTHDGAQLPKGQMHTFLDDSHEIWNVAGLARPFLSGTCAAILQFSAPTYSVDEDARNAIIVVTRTLDTSSTVGVDYATSDGTATAGRDYIATSGTLTFGPGETSRSFAIPILRDAVFEGEETVNLTLSKPTREASLGSQRTAILTINEQIEVQEISTRSGWTGNVLATRRTWSIAGQQFVEVIRYGVTKRICPVTGVFLDCPVTWNVWKFVPLPGSFISPGATPPQGAVVMVRPDNVITESCNDLDPLRRFSSRPADCPPTIVSDATFITSTSPSFTFPLCFSTHSCGVYDPASPYLGQAGYTAELLTGCISEPCPPAYACPLPCVEGNPNWPRCLTEGHCP